MTEQSPLLLNEAVAELIYMAAYKQRNFNPDWHNENEKVQAIYRASAKHIINLVRAWK